MSGPIVVPLDGSSAAERARDAAIDIARRFQAGIHLLSVEAAGHAQLGDTAAALEQRLGPGRVFTASFDQDVARSVGDYARDTRARMIVLDGSTAQADSLLARLADAVTRRSGVPVLLVREADTKHANNDWRCQRILVPLDGSVLAEQIIPSVAALATRFEARITLLRILPEIPRASAQGGVPLRAPLSPAGRQREALTELETIARLLRASGLSVNTRVVETPLPIATAILQQAREQKSDLIALASRGYGVAKQFAFGSVARDLVNDATVGLFILLPRERTARAGGRRSAPPALQSV